MSEAKKFTGLIVAKEQRESEDREPLTGLLETKARTAATQSRLPRDRSRPGPVQRVAVSGGVSAATVRINSMTPHAVLADGERWDVRTFPYVRLQGGVGEIVLPDPTQTLEQRAGAIPRDDQCELNGEPKPLPPNDHKSWAIEARAILPNAMSAAAIENALSAPVVGGGSVSVSLAGSVPTLSGMQITMSGEIEKRDANGQTYTETYQVETDLENLYPNNSYESVVDLVFYSVDGGGWECVATRIDV